MPNKLIRAVRKSLIANGYGGLFCRGECACDIDDLAPCGEYNRERGEDFINGCEGGYKHIHSKPPHDFVVSMKKEPMSDEEIESVINAI